MADGTDFDLRVRPAADGARVSVSGELDAYTAPQLRKVLDEVLDGSVKRLVVDLCATTFVDSTGLGVLVGASRRAKVQAAEFELDSPSRSVYRVLQITGLTLSIPIENPPAGLGEDEDRDDEPTLTAPV